VARDVHLAFDGFEVVGSFAGAELAGLISVNGHAQHYHGKTISSGVHWATFKQH